MSSTVAFFFFKQKTAYEMRISDWSSDVCSSDLVRTRNHPAVADLHRLLPAPVAAVEHEAARRLDRTAEEDRLVEWFVMFDLELVEHGADGHPVDRIVDTDPHRAILVMADHREIGRASRRERVCQYV